MTGDWRTVAAADLPALLAAWLDTADGVVRVAIDGADALHPDELADSLLAPLQLLGRGAHHVRAASFWQDASLRLEHGRRDVASYLNWLDAGALRREVLEAAARDAVFLPSLRDSASNRSTREAPRPLGEHDVLLVSGEFLLGLGLPFDRVVRLTAPPAALARRTDDAAQWTLAAHAEYDDTVQPDELADVVVRADRRHPVVLGLPGWDAAR
ncbi:uridine kinase [uncultured Jatrophihabitans sp.]|uniref:uridine kinase n=1 Tax=uncultured Jatrophihabitans sp. TaxID=1610747 RepID=UPI0035CC4372